MKTAFYGKPISEPLDLRSILRKVNTIDNVIIGHTALQNAIDGIENCLLWSESSLEPRGAILIGEGGTGKTTICNTLLKKFPSFDTVVNNDVIKQVPAFFTSVPSPSSIKSLAASMLKSLGEIGRIRGTALDMTDRLIDQLETSGTKLIILDELHNLLAASPSVKGLTLICNWLRYLIDESGVTMCLVGTPTCESIVNVDGQIRRRFADRFRLENFRCDSDVNQKAMKQYMTTLARQFVSRLELQDFIDFEDPTRVVQVWLATDGNPKFISLLLKEATAIALASSRTSVVISDLAEVFDTGLLCAVSRCSTNPFEMKATVLEQVRLKACAGRGRSYAAA